MKVPVVIFCYTRLNYLKRVIEALSKNAEAVDTELFFYSDGGKDEKTWQQVQVVRDYLYTITGFKKVTVIEQKENKKLEFNVIQGITEVVNQFGKVIVLEDDILPSRYFLQYMNDALTYYEDKKEVMSVSAYNFLKHPKDFSETYALRFDGGWGWGTWKDRWDKFQYFEKKEEALRLLTPEEQREIQFNNTFYCLDFLEHAPVTWDICWNICVFKHGVSIMVSHSLTAHIGVEGTHFNQGRNWSFLHKQAYSPIGFSDNPVTYLTDDLSPNKEVYCRMEKYHHGHDLTLLGKCIYNILYYLYPYCAAALQKHFPQRIKRFYDR